MIIGLTGLKGSGKTTIAKYLQSEYQFNEYALADPLKRIAMIFGFTERELYQDKLSINPTLGICAREFLQKFGTLCRTEMSNIFPDVDIIWIKLMEDYINNNIDTNICISDVRYYDEMHAIRKINGSDPLIIKVIKRNRASDMYESHSSEAGIQNEHVDYVVTNDEGFENLYEKIDNIILNINDKKMELRRS